MKTITSGQIAKLQAIRNQSHIKEVDFGHTSDGTCHLKIIDIENRISSMPIDENGKIITR